MQVPHGQTGAHARGDGVPRPDQEPGTPLPWRLDVIGHFNGADGTSIALRTRYCPTQTECGLVEIPRHPWRVLNGGVVPRRPGQRRSELRERHTAPSLLEPGVVWRQPVRTPPLLQRSEFVA
ncbi:predicted protein [Chaetomium globosum CBS 148.51]|uniref:Uncharacterized protein n=1 Tax=Chaetomium globosum (strain ATCC 6205 / CBS 148.51 / DSM 1962 / NBRC 6347 / NRRL 1970) TaxID=306901 RepID=Q2GPI7_CHAGB|nr:uncharacterized protein CHGG_10117 [Chaetomium globosum CBS 148.51]EAQ83713.1 predicted protein [Chaetomium globosum CBS 148.51]